MKRWHYGWTMVVLASGMLFLTAFPLGTFGVYLIPVATQFNWDRGAVSLALSANMLIVGAMNIPTGRLCDKYGPRPLITAFGLSSGIAFILLSFVGALWQFYFIWGFLLAIGGCCSYLPIVATIPRWFPKKGGIAIGLALSGMSLGGMASPLLAQWLIAAYDWRRAYLVFGIIFLIIVVPLAQLMKPNPKATGSVAEKASVAASEASAEGARGYSFHQALKSWPFWVVSLLMFSYFFVHSIVQTHLVPHVTDTGISPAVAARTLSILMATGLIGTNLAGFLSRRVSPSLVLAGHFVLMMFTILVLLSANSEGMFYFFAGLYGIAYGGMLPLMNLITEEWFGLRSLGFILGGIIFSGMVGGAIGAPVAGYVFDSTTSYQTAFLICIAFAGVAVASSLVLTRYQRSTIRVPSTHP